MKIHHIGYLVQDMAAAIQVLQEIGYQICRPSMHDSVRGGSIAFMQNEQTIVELIAPDKDCQEYKSLAKRIGNGPYHICYIADDFDKDIEKLKESGWRLIKPPQNAIAIDGRKVSFFYHDTVGIIELLE